MEATGSFGGDLQSAGKPANLQPNSAMSEGAITGGATLGLSDPLPLDGKISVRNLNLDPFLLSALHLGKFKGHGTADGDITFQSQLHPPQPLTPAGNFSPPPPNYPTL